MRRPKLPGAFILGPYTMRFVWDSSPDANWELAPIQADWTNEVFRVRHNLRGGTLRYWLVRAVILAIHYRSGATESSDEESFTHMLATGLVELAQRNPAFWKDFCSLLGVPPAKGPKRAPSFVEYNGTRCVFQLFSPEDSTREEFAFFVMDEKPYIEFNRELRGVNFAIVLVHEVMHFLHYCEGLSDTSTENDFRGVQTKALMGFAVQNKKFWRWYSNEVLKVS